MYMKLIFEYLYFECGGYGDLFKGLMTTYCLAKLSKRDLIIDFSNHVLGEIFPQYNIKYIATTKYDLLSYNKTYFKQFVNEIMNNKQEIISIKCNIFELPLFDANIINYVREFNQCFYKTLLPIENLHMNITNYNNYVVLHCRMGDAFLSGGTISSDIRTLKSDVERKVITFNENIKEKTQIACDNVETLNFISNLVTNEKFTICKEPYHMSSNTCINDKTKQSIKETIYEHYVMSKAKAIYILSNSGYPITASWICNIPIYVIN